MPHQHPIRLLSCVQLGSGIHFYWIETWVFPLIHATWNPDSLMLFRPLIFFHTYITSVSFIAVHWGGPIGGECFCYISQAITKPQVIFLGESLGNPVSSYSLTYLINLLIVLVTGVRSLTGYNSWSLKKSKTHCMTVALIVPTWYKLPLWIKNMIANAYDCINQGLNQS